VRAAAYSLTRNVRIQYSPQSAHEGNPDTNLLHAVHILVVELSVQCKYTPSLFLGI